MIGVCHSIVEILQSKGEQDAREAMRVVFFCTRKTYLYSQNKISYEYIQILFSKLYSIDEFANCNSANYDV